MPLTLAASGDAPNEVYGGVTAQKSPVVIELSRGGTLIKRAVVGVALTCTSGRQLADYDGAPSEFG